MIFADPIPAEMQSGEFYRESASYYLSEDKLESDYSPVRFARELKLFRRCCRGGSILDVGCSSGGFLFQLNRHYPGQYEVLGTDISTPTLQQARAKGVPIVEADFLRHNFGSQRFDAISFWAVVEHLVEPKRFLDRAADLLKPEGLCFVLVPNMGSLAVRLLGSRYRYIFPEHLNYFTRRTLTALVANRFDVVDIRYTHFNPIVILQDVRNRDATMVAQVNRSELLKKTTALKTNPLLAPLRLLYGFGESILASVGLADNLVLVLRKRTSYADSK